MLTFITDVGDVIINVGHDVIGDVDGLRYHLEVLFDNSDNTGFIMHSAYGSKRMSNVERTRNPLL